jgi:hypothetical protein
VARLTKFLTYREFGVLEFLQNLVLTNPLEFYTAVVATAGVVFWFLDRQSMKAALSSARSSEAIVLRLERQKTEAKVERSLLDLQIRCQAARDAWQYHNLRCGPRLSGHWLVPQEQKELQRLEQAGKALVDRLWASAPKQESSEFDELQTYFVVADRTSQEIIRLGAQIPMPNNRLS